MELYKGLGLLIRQAITAVRTLRSREWIAELLEVWRNELPEGRMEEDLGVLKRR
jgi:hypothetical protein